MKKRNIFMEEITGLLALWAAQNFAALTVEPSNTTAKLGQRITVLNCSISNANDIADWWWVRTGQTELIPIFQSNTLVYLYEDHITVEKGSNGQYNLVIHDVTFSDAGLYTCFDEGSLQSAVDNGHFASAELVVIDLTMNCTHNMSAGGIVGGDICQLGLEPDYILLTCSLRYKGNVVPTISRRRLDDDDFLAPVIDTVLHTRDYYVLTSTTVVQANERMNGSYFTCTTSMNWNKNSFLHEYQDLNITWTSPVIDLIFLDYVSLAESTKTTQEICSSTTEISCSVHSNLVCKYRWTHPTSTIIINSNVLKPSLFTNWIGIYKCTIECGIRRRLCQVLATTVIAVNCSIDESTKAYHIMSTAVHKFILPAPRHYLISLFLLIIAVLVLIIGIFRVRRSILQKQNSKSAHINRQVVDRNHASAQETTLSMSNAYTETVTSKTCLLQVTTQQ